jgi:hypothetical protein
MRLTRRETAFRDRRLPLGRWSEDPSFPAWSKRRHEQELRLSNVAEVIHRRRPRRLTRNNWRDNYRNNSCHAASRQCNRLAANKHRSTVPDVTAVRVILIKLPTAVETTGIGRSVGRNDFGLRFLAAMEIPGRVRLHGSLTPTLPCRVDPDLSAHSMSGR